MNIFRLKRFIIIDYFFRLNAVNLQVFHIGKFYFHTKIENKLKDTTKTFNNQLTTTLQYQKPIKNP